MLPSLCCNLFLGASAMTTKFLDNKMCTSKFYCRGVPHEKQRFGRFSSLPPRPPASKSKIYFYCRLAVSEFQSPTRGRKIGAARKESKCVENCLTPFDVAPFRWPFLWSLIIESRVTIVHTIYTYYIPPRRFLGIWLASYT